MARRDNRSVFRQAGDFVQNAAAGMGLYNFDKGEWGDTSGPKPLGGPLPDSPKPENAKGTLLTAPQRADDIENDTDQKNKRGQ